MGTWEGTYNGIWNMDYDIGNSLRRVQPNVVSNISHGAKKWHLEYGL
jgi:hypothetical protein